MARIGAWPSGAPSHAEIPLRVVPCPEGRTEVPKQGWSEHLLLVACGERAVCRVLAAPTGLQERSGMERSRASFNAFLPAGAHANCCRYSGGPGGLGG